MFYLSSPTVPICKELLVHNSTSSFTSVLKILSSFLLPYVWLVFLVIKLDPLFSNKLAASSVCNQCPIMVCPLPCMGHAFILGCPTRGHTRLAPTGLTPHVGRAVAQHPPHLPRALTPMLACRAALPGAGESRCEHAALHHAGISLYKGSLLSARHPETSSWIWQDCWGLQKTWNSFPSLWPEWSSS